MGLFDQLFLRYRCYICSFQKRTFSGLSTNSKLILRANDFYDHLSQEYMDEKNQKSISLTTLPKFSSIIKGLRKNELTIFTGPTGSGKTTFLSQISLDYCVQGVNTLWGSFEIKFSRLARIMIQQISAAIDTKSSNRTDSHDFDDSSQTNDPNVSAIDQLTRMPMYFMNMFGSSNIDVILKIMEHAHINNGVFLFILDNLQFLLSDQGETNFDRFELGDRVIHNIRNFCNRFPVHVILVIHPRKEMDDTMLGLASVSGTAKATQEADNVIILQKIQKDRFIEIKKNRYDGETGMIKINYVASSKLIYETIS